MLIRCERCSTVYELDESVLPPEGAPVQCTRCDDVFVAYPPRAAGRTLVGVPAVQPPAEPAPPPAPPPQAAEEPRSRPAPGPRAPATDRSRAPAQVYRPTPGPGVPVRAAPVLRKDQVGAFEARLRASARWRWLAPTLAAAVVLVAGAAWLYLSDRRDPQAVAARTEGLALLALDDAGNLDAAIARLDDAARREPRRVEAAADAAFARVLRAEGLREEADDARAAAPPGEAAPGADAQLAKARALAAAAASALAALPQETSLAPPVVRARAALHAHLRERARTVELAAGARARGETDPWLELAEAAVDLDGAPEARDRAVVRLGGLAARHPELVRARWLLARGQATLGRTTEALAALEAVLSANARHEGARRLRARLTAPPPPPAPPENAEGTDGNAIAQPQPPPRRRPRAEALPAVVPELSPSPSADLRPLVDEVPQERLRPAALPAEAAGEPVGGERPAPVELAPAEPTP